MSDILLFPAAPSPRIANTIRDEHEPPPPPILRAHQIPGIEGWAIWCPFCGEPHFHDRGEGPQRAHCHHAAASPYAETGYVLIDAGPLPDLAALVPDGAIMPAMRLRYPRRKQPTPPNMIIAVLQAWTGQQGKTIEGLLSGAPTDWVCRFGNGADAGGLSFDLTSSHWSISYPPPAGAEVSPLRQGQGLILLGATLFGIAPSRLAADLRAWLGVGV